MRGVLGLHAKEYKALARGQGLPEDMPKRTLMRLWVKRLLVDEVLWQYSAFSQAAHPPTCTLMSVSLSINFSCTLLEC